MQICTPRAQHKTRARRAHPLFSFPKAKRSSGVIARPAISGASCGFSAATALVYSFRDSNKQVAACDFHTNKKSQTSKRGRKQQTEQARREQRQTSRAQATTSRASRQTRQHKQTSPLPPPPLNNNRTSACYKSNTTNRSRVKWCRVCRRCARSAPSREVAVRRFPSQRATRRTHP